MIFVVKYISVMVFGGGALKIWGNPYLNSTTILFDYIYGQEHVCDRICENLHIFHTTVCEII